MAAGLRSSNSVVHCCIVPREPSRNPIVSARERWIGSDGRQGTGPWGQEEPCRSGHISQSFAEIALSIDLRRLRRFMVCGVSHPCLTTIESWIRALSKTLTCHILQLTRNLPITWAVTAQDFNQVGL